MIYIGYSVKITSPRALLIAENVTNMAPQPRERLYPFGFFALMESNASYKTPQTCLSSIGKHRLSHKMGRLSKPTVAFGCPGGTSYVRNGPSSTPTDCTALKAAGNETAPETEVPPQADTVRFVAFSKLGQTEITPPAG